jgi:hypothetical protein
LGRRPVHVLGAYLSALCCFAATLSLNEMIRIA